MDRIRKVIKQTDNRFLNMYELEVTHRDGKTSPYYMASRIENPAKIKAVTKDNNPNGVIMYGIYGEQKDKVVLVRQYRYPIGSYVYEFPAGLVEPGENLIEAGVREMYEETGLTFAPVEAGCYTKPFFTTVPSYFPKKVITVLSFGLTTKRPHMKITHTNGMRNMSPHQSEYSLASITAGTAIPPIKPNSVKNRASHPLAGLMNFSVP